DRFCASAYTGAFVLGALSAVGRRQTGVTGGLPVCGLWQGPAFDWGLDAIKVLQARRAGSARPHLSRILTFFGIGSALRSARDRQRTSSRLGEGDGLAERQHEQRSATCVANHYASLDPDPPFVHNAGYH